MDILGPILQGGHASSAILAGHYAGLWTVLHNSPNKQWAIGELADAADCKERWVKEWVGVLASAKVITLHDDMTVSCHPGVAKNLLSSSETLHFFSSLEFTFDKESKIGACFKKDGPLGCGYDEYPNFQDWMAGWTNCRNKNQNFPTGYFKLAGNGIHEALEKGIRVLEPGCGKGRHVFHAAKHYPNSNFICFDIDTETLAANRIVAKEEALDNIEFKEADFCNMPQEWTNSFDFVMIFDCMHDLPFPSKAMKGLKNVLKDNGVVTMLDIAASSDMTKMVKNPGAACLYNISLHHCMSVSLSFGGEGVGTCWGVELAKKMLKGAEWEENEIQVIVGPIPGHAVYVLTKGDGIKGGQ